MLKVIDLFILLNGLMSIPCTSQSMFGAIIESPLNYSFAPSSVQPVDRFITFSESPLQQLALPHNDALVLTLEVGKHLMKRILIYPVSAIDLLYLPTLLRLDYKSDNLRNPCKVLVRFNNLKTHLLGEIMLLISEGPVTTLVPLTVVDKHSSFNTI